ncbi:MAG: hypothetical protein BWY82_00803 [Verrucomicrobia bacterium ADurb.Bin474]|nr:MAG: hypothetical protein BWY82_00803 [Verrucomicrobia bacterium ADurb.Bin474]
MGQLAYVFLEVNAGQANPTVFAHHIARRPIHLNLDRPAQAQWLVVLRDLVVLGHVGVVVMLTVPLAHIGDLTAQHQTDLNGLFDGPLVEHWQRPRHSHHHRIGQFIR